MATSIVGILSMGYADRSRDFDSIMAGLIDEYESDPANEWSVDWSRKYTWAGGALSAPTNNPNPRRATLANDIELRGFFVEANDPAIAANLATAMWTAAGANHIDVLIGTSTPALRALHAARPGGDTRPIVMAFTGDVTQVVQNAGDRDFITGVVDHSFHQLEVQVDVLKKLYSAYGGTKPNPKLGIISNANNPGKTAEMAQLTTLMGGGANAAVVPNITSATDLTPDKLAIALGPAPKGIAADMVIVLGDPLTFQNASSIRGYFDGLINKIPVIFGAPESAEDGAIIACGPSHDALFRGAGPFVRAVLNSATPATPARGISPKGPKASDVELVLNHKTRRDRHWPDFPENVKGRKHTRHIH